MSSTASGLAWKMNRLRTMSPAEVAYRVRSAIQTQLEANGIGLVKPMPPSGRAGQTVASGKVPQLDPAPYLAAAESILTGRYRIFAIEAKTGFPPPWNLCPRTGTMAPMSFGKLIDYRDERIVGDIKYLWEPSRHLELVTLAQAWALNKDQRFIEGCRMLLDSWFETCPYPNGVHWTSSLEHAIRLVNWAFAWGLLGGEESPLFVGADGGAFRTRWLTVIRQHLHFIANHFSRYSSANNHLLGEYLGLLVGCTVWPLWPECTEWRHKAISGFAHEALAQNTPDGVNREQAVYYQHEVMDMMLIAGLTLRANGEDFAPAFWERFERLSEFLLAVMDSAGHVPMIGDSDDALIVRLDPAPAFEPWRPLMCAAALLTGRGDFAAAAGGRIDDKTRWLLPDAELPSANAHAPPRRLFFPEGGYAVIGAALGTDEEIQIVFDAAPLGYLDIAAHGHADALSFTLSAFGVEWLVDPGTFAYHTQNLWRDHFRSTAAHNTIGLDGLDQSQIGGNFMWLHKAHAHFTGVGESWVEGEHDGYRRLNDPVTHRRRVDLDAQTATITVLDTLTGRGNHAVTLNWQFAEGCNVRLEEGEITATAQEHKLRIVCSHAGFTPSLHYGEEAPPTGWVSRKFDHKVPAMLARWTGTTCGTTSVETTITLV
jgi:hypothetical protein